MNDNVLNPWDQKNNNLADSIIEACNDKTYEERLDLLAEKIVDDLPHGSDINCKWNFTITDNVINFNNSFHVMNEVGFYVYYVDFNFDIRVIDPIEEIIDLLDFNYDSNILKSNSCGLDEYIEDTIYYSLCDKYNII